MAHGTLTPVISNIGYQGCGLTAKTGATATGLSTTTQYYFKVRKDIGAVTEVNITTASTVTFTAVIALMNAAMTGALAGCVWSLKNGDLCCTSPTTGPGSMISLAAGSSGTDLFATLTGFVGFASPITGMPIHPDVTERYITFFGSMKVSAPADTYETGGIATSFAGVAPTGSAPVWVKVLSRGPSSGTLGNIYSFVPGTNETNGKTIVLLAKGNAVGLQALEECTDALAYNDASTSTNLDRIVFKATWRKGS